MLIFKKITYKNFLASGNNPITINFTGTATTLIVGTNGAGKTTVTDALSFALFGKAYRSVNKAQLINSINQKDCLVEVEFSIGSSDYKVIRGLKPNKFEIWRNGAMLNQEANVKDYQTHLEQNILKLNHKTFHQVVVLGSSSYTPFMKLSAANRRGVIEDLLDIGIFSRMNMVAKGQMQKLKDSIRETESDMSLNAEKVKLQRKYIADVSSINDDQVKRTKERIENANTEIERLRKENADYDAQIEASPDLTKKKKTLETQQKQYGNYAANFSAKVKNLVSDAQFYEKNTTCPTCTQDISEELRNEKLKTSRDKAKEIQAAMKSANGKLKEVETSISEVNDSIAAIRDIQNKIQVNNSQITTHQKTIRELNEEINKASSADSDLSVANEKLRKLVDEGVSLSEERSRLVAERSYNEVIIEMLKDSGIKTKIIKQYLPVMNTLINKYLAVFDFFVSFNIDETFNETIRSRHRDTFSYDSFSEGEKQKIDLSILFAWRHIAKMKNSVSTNLLFMDETFDSSLDVDGIDNLVEIIGGLSDDTNVFIISHKGDVLDGKFDRKLSFTKENNFSKMEE